MKTALRLLLAPYRFSVDRLFRMGQIGGAHWFDSPSLYPGGNHLYLYKDNAGTTPVTAVGDTIGLSLDRAFGGYRGPERWDTSSAMVVGEASQVSSGVYRIYSSAGANSYVQTSAAMTVGRTYEVRLTVDSIATLGGGVQVGDTGAVFTTVGAKRCIHVAVSTSAVIKRAAGATDIQISGLSVREIPGTHLIQATGTARPTLSARVNLLLNSENFSNASWTKRSGGSVSATNSATAPNGTVTADTWLQSGTPGTTSVHSTTTVPASANLKHSISVKPISGQWVALAALDTSGTDGFTAWFDLTNGVKGTASTSGSGATLGAWNITPEANGFYRIDVSGIVGTDTSIWSCFLFVVTADGSTTRLADGSCYVWGADLRTADDAAKNIPAYQRVGATAADHDTDGFPHGQYPDGTDDNQTTTTGGGGTTGFFYCGAITVSGGAGTARTIWSDTGTNTGYRVRINSSNKLELAAGNGSAYTTVESNETITAPGTYILSAWDDGGVLAVQVNNFAAATTTRPTVSAGTSTATMYKDNGAASSYLNGRDYGSVYRQSYIGESQHARLKRWLADRARITL